MVLVIQDVGVLESTSELAEKNTSRLGVESARLAEHTKTSCRCWVWFILLIVTMTFVGTFASSDGRDAMLMPFHFFPTSFAAMVMVMKIFRKRTWT